MPTLNMRLNVKASKRRVLNMFVMCSGCFVAYIQHKKAELVVHRGSCAGGKPVTVII